MVGIRKPYQGVWNIIRFNWHFYALLGIILPVLFFILNKFVSTNIAVLVIAILVVPVIVSLVISHWVYDRSGLYELDYLDRFNFNESNVVVNINAGFDETSTIIRNRFPKANLEVFDFYNPERHTEVSIKRARKAYPPYSGTIPIDTSSIPLEVDTASAVFLIMSAHEIRNKQERITLLKEIHRTLKTNGRVIVVEHLRDVPNFLAYTVGVFHFFSKPNWMHCFGAAKFKLDEEIKITPFVSTFILTKNGTTP